MTFNAPSFFAGIGTVVGLVLLGFGGGVFMASVILDQGARTPSKMERQVSQQAQPAGTEAQPSRAPAAAAQPLPAVETPDEPPPAVQPPKLQNVLTSPASASVSAPSPGPQKPVSLANPTPEATATRKETHRKKEDARRDARARRHTKPRKLAQPSQQQAGEAELKAASTDRSKQDDVRPEGPDERPLLRPERDDSLRAPRSNTFRNGW